MFRLTNKLAISNLIKNRKLYYPFALSVILAVTISYLFYSLAFNPKIVDLRGASAIQFTLQLGLVVVTLASAIIVLYANSFVMKNRSKELGVYGMLGLEKRHLIGMTFKELLIFGLVTVTAGIGIGALFDNLIFALLLKLAKMKVELVATFQWSVVFSILLVFGLVFLLIVFLNGTDTATIKNSEASSFRREKLGFVFQDFNLLDTLSVKDNILLPLVLSRKPITEMMKKLVVTAENLGINQLQEKYPYEISGGQKQRVAVARAIITEPEILLADEPTGALDSKSSAALLDIFDQINEQGQTILMVTHSTAAASRAKRVLFIKDGILYNQIYRGEKTDRQMFQEISDTLTVMASEVN